jgi:hypothetical protein
MTETSKAGVLRKSAWWTYPPSTFWNKTSLSQHSQAEYVGLICMLAMSWQLLNKVTCCGIHGDRAIMIKPNLPEIWARFIKEVRLEHYYCTNRYDKTQGMSNDKIEVCDRKYSKSN